MTLPPTLQNLALCTASLMYILSRDRLNMDLDRSCLELMIRLLELDQDQDQVSEQGGCSASTDSTPQFSAREIAKIKEKIRKLCDTVHNKHLDLENITVRRSQSDTSHCARTLSLTRPTVLPVPADGSPGHGDAAVADVQEGRRLVQGGAAAAGGSRPHRGQR